MGLLKKIFTLLSISEKKRFYLLLTLILMMAFLDMLGVASILPFVAVLANLDLIETNTYLAYFYQKSSVLGVTGKKDFLFIIGVLGCTLI